MAATLARADAIVDGLVGLGATPPLRPVAAMLVAAANAAVGWRIADADLPSGIDPDTGRETGVVFRADVTVTFGGMKTALLFGEAAGLVEVAEIGMSPSSADAAVRADALILTDDDAARLAPQPGATDDKFSLGVTGVIAGSARYPGAALLAVGGAVAARPGLVRYAGPCAGDVLRRWPEAVAVAEFSQAGRVQAWVIGSASARAGRRSASCATCWRPTCRCWWTPTGSPCLRRRRRCCTGAPGAAPRPCSLRMPVSSPGSSRIWIPRPDGWRRCAARQPAAAPWRCSKGHRTVIADPDGQAFVNLSGSPYLATAGSGDVLSGLAGALLSTGLIGPMAGRAGRVPARPRGERAAAARHAGASALLEYLG